MRDDLLDPHACVDWAETQIPAFSERVDAWLQLNIEVRVEDPDPSVPDNVIVAVEKEILPLSFNVEFGAYLNTIRTSLDILAVALAIRHCIPSPEEKYFPVARDISQFASGIYRGSEFVKALPPAERAKIESLKPYKGGNDSLWHLHHLDITRKHRRLLSVGFAPARFTISGWGGELMRDFTPIASGWISVNDKTVLGLLRKGAPQRNLQFTPQVAVSETALSFRKPIIAALRDFARLAGSIIQRFD